MSIDCAHHVHPAREPRETAEHQPPLILIHGIGSWHRTWDSLLPGLTRRRTVITYDLRGHGSSPIPDGPFDLGDLVDDLERLRVKLGIDRTHLAGHSLGGMIGPAYARRHPERVASLTLLSTAAFRTAEDSAKVNAVVEAMNEQGIDQILPTLTDRWFTDGFAADNPDIIQSRLERVLATPAEVFLQVFDIYANTEMGPYLNELTMPSLVLTAENDSGCNPRLNRQVAAALPDSRLVILPNYKHSILLEAGAVVAAEVDRFLESLSSKSHE